MEVSDEADRISTRLTPCTFFLLSEGVTFFAEHGTMGPPRQLVVTTMDGHIPSHTQFEAFLSAKGVSSALVFHQQSPGTFVAMEEPSHAVKN